MAGGAAQPIAATSFSAVAGEWVDIVLPRIRPAFGAARSCHAGHDVVTPSSRRLTFGHDARVAYVRISIIFTFE